MTQQYITKSTVIGDIVADYPEIIETLLSYGVHCVGCHVSGVEPLGAGLMGHGFSEEQVEEVVLKLNEEIGKLKSDKKEEKKSPAEMNIEITDAASDKIQEMLKKDNKEDGWGLRIQVVPGGCSGFQYQMLFDNKTAEDDKVFEKNGIKVFVDHRSLEMMHGAKIDYIESLQGAGFKVDNPNTEKSCGCGSSFG